MPPRDGPKWAVPGKLSPSTMQQRKEQMLACTSPTGNTRRKVGAISPVSPGSRLYASYSLPASPAAASLSLGTDRASRQSRHAPSPEHLTAEMLEMLHAQMAEECKENLRLALNSSLEDKISMCSIVHLPLAQAEGCSDIGGSA